MLLILLAYLGGVLTILSPCILPVLPFVFARADRPFVRSGLPMLVGMALTFALVATLAAVAGGWAVAANQYGRIAAITLLALFGLTLLFPGLSDRLTRPLVGLGSRLSNTAEQAGGSDRSVLPVLPARHRHWTALGALRRTRARPDPDGGGARGRQRRHDASAARLCAGRRDVPGLALLIGGRVFATMKRSLGAGEWVRRGLGVAVLAGVAAIALGLDTGLLTRVSLASTTSLEQNLLDKFHSPEAQVGVRLRWSCRASPEP